MRRTRIGWVVGVGIALVLAYLVFASTTLVQAECELCIEYRGQVECRRGSGTNEAEARQAAQKAACGLLASGMNDVIACQNRQPQRVRCSAP